ncbi:MAG: germination protein YpeB [Clostridia bacterium]|nr:germination protein YpeB [Clostridia bacterium]
MKRRKKIRLRAFIGTLILALGIWGAVGNIRARGYEKEIALNNQNSLFQLCEYMDSIETDLMKSTYAVSGEMLGTLTDRLQRDTAGAKESLSFLSPGETPLSGTYKFLSQVGDFTAYLSRKAERGEKITEEERAALQELSTLAAELSLKFQYMGDLLTGDYFSFREISDAVVNSSPDSESTVSYIDTISDAEEAFGNYPKLIYDGPFSDNMLEKDSVFLEGKEEITKEEAKKIAAEILGTEEKMLVEENDTEGRLAAYCFRTEIYSISVTKRGGYPLEIMSVITAGEEKHSQADAAERAKNFLRLQGFFDMVTTYTASNDGICTVNFAYKQGSFICYPDLIKVSVSLSDGRITAFEASDYLMNHRERELPPFGITPEEAMQDIIGTVTKVSAAVIPQSDGTERYTYELLCEGTDGQHILVYKDIETGEEADILILLYSDNGTLTK